jgi:hypothetical protein
MAADAEVYPAEQDVDVLLEEFGGNARAAIRALLHDVEVLAADYDRSVSRGYVRGKPQLLAGRRALQVQRRR